MQNSGAIMNSNAFGKRLESMPKSHTPNLNATGDAAATLFGIK
jgi:hypothetical protein